MIRFIVYLVRMAKCAVTGNRQYYLWLGVLLAFVAMGGVSWAHHLEEGLIVSNMTDHVSWGIGIANFVYFVGVAVGGVARSRVPITARTQRSCCSASLAWSRRCALTIVTTWVSRLALHLTPIGSSTSRSCRLDVLVFNGYPFLNLHPRLCARRHLGESRARSPICPSCSSRWCGRGIHTVTAFLLGLGSRHFWNTPILAPRFLISAGASAPALMILLFTVIKRVTKLDVKDSVFEYFKYVLRITMPINLFLLGCEVFHEFYTGALHSASAYYLYFGLHGHSMLTAFIWTAIAFNDGHDDLFSSQASQRQPRAVRRLRPDAGRHLIGKVWD
jgi:molybdopterin-containing oxidoreductase family membrane subunit